MKQVPTNWYEDFFYGVSLDLWRKAFSPQQTMAAQLTRVLRPDGALLTLFSTTQPDGKLHYTKYVVADETSLVYRTYPAARGRQAVLLSRDLTLLFGTLRVADSFLLQNNVRELLFRKPA